jgi:hypothetical protein
MSKLLLSVWCLALVLPFTGCSQMARELVNKLRSLSSSASGQSDQSGENLEADAVKYDADTTYHNGFLGFSYTVPRGWWLYRRQADNFSTDPGDTSDLAGLDISYGEDAGLDYSYIGLITFANLQFSTRDNHLGFHISAETLDGIDNLAEYMEYYENYMLEPDDDEYELLDSGGAEINGLAWERRVFEIIREEDNYRYVTFTKPVNNGYYLTIKVSYWPENKNAEETIRAAIARAIR